MKRLTAFQLVENLFGKAGVLLYQIVGLGGDESFSGLMLLASFSCFNGAFDMIPSESAIGTQLKLEKFSIT